MYNRPGMEFEKNRVPDIRTGQNAQFRLKNNGPMSSIHLVPFQSKRNS
jgi:hypothetical protein